MLGNRVIESKEDGRRRTAQTASSPLRAPSPLFLRLNAEPLRLTYRGADGATHIAALAHKERFVFHPDLPDGMDGALQAALLFTSHNRSLTLVERSVRPSAPKMFTEDGTWPVEVDGITVHFSGPENAPSAWWEQESVLFWLINSQQTIDQEEALCLIRSLQPLP